MQISEENIRTLLAKDESSWEVNVEEARESRQLKINMTAVLKNMDAEFKELIMPE